MPPPAAIGIDPKSYGREIEAAGFTSVWHPGVNSAADLAAIAPRSLARNGSYSAPESPASGTGSLTSSPRPPTGSTANIPDGSSSASG